MTKQYGQMQPHWLDAVIESTWREQGAATIATAITHNDKLLAAIRQGLVDARHLPEQQPGLSQAQCIHHAVLEAMEG